MLSLSAEIKTKMKIAAALILVSGIFGAGYWVAQLRYEKQIADIHTSLAEARSAAVEEGLERHALADQLNAEKTKKREVIYKTITKEVDRYVQNPNAGRCILPDDWVRIHNSAATSGTASLANDTANSPRND